MAVKPGEDRMAQAEATRQRTPTSAASATRSSAPSRLGSSTREGGFAGASVARDTTRDNIGTGFRGPTSTWGTSRSVVPGSLLDRQSATALSPYGGAFNVTQDQLVRAAMEGAPLIGGTPQNPSLMQLREMAAQVQASPELQGVLGALYGPFMGAPTPTVSPNLLDAALTDSLPAAEAPSAAVPDIETAVEGPSAVDQLTYSGPKGVSELNPAARSASVMASGMNIPKIQYTQKDLDNATRMVLAESSNIVNERGELNIPAAQAVADVIRNRVLSEQFPNSVQGVLSQRRQFEPYGSGAFRSSQFGPKNPNYAAVRDVVEAVFSGEAAPVVGGAVNFGNNAIIQGRPEASAATERAFAQMAADPSSVTFYSARNPSQVQQTFGVLPGAEPVQFGMAAAPRTPPRIQPVQAVTDVAYNFRPSAQTGMQPLPAPIQVAELPVAEVARASAQPTLPPRTPTPGLLDRIASRVFGTTNYGTAPVESLLADRGDRGDQRLANLGLEMAAAAAPQPAPAPAPVYSAAAALPDWYVQWYNSRGRTGGLLA